MRLAGTVATLACALLGCMSLAQSEPPSSAGAVVSLGTKAISVDVPASAFPAKGSKAREYLVPAGEPFKVGAALPLPGDWLLVVAVAVPLTRRNGVDFIPGDAVEYRISPLANSNSRCELAAPGKGSWYTVGAGSRAAVIRGPVTCHFTVTLRLRLSTAIPPGTYTGSLAWSLRYIGP